MRYLISAEEIILKKFRRSGYLKTGYDRIDVNDFLDDVADTVRELNRIIDNLKKTKVKVKKFAKTNHKK
jgi:DivIVA domain-containing protein